MKKINWYKIFFLAMVIVATWLLWQTCKGKKVVEQPNVKPSIEIVKDTVALAALKKHLADSFNLLLSKLDRTNDKQYQEYLAALNTISELEADNTILKIPVPDTCQSLNVAWIDKYNKYVKQSNAATRSANNTISGLNQTIGTQKKYLSQKDIDYNKLHSLLDTCTKGYAILEKSNKQLQPKREVAAGIRMLSAYAGIIKPEFGLELSYRNKKAMEISVGYYTNQTVSVGLKKRLFKL